MLSLMRNWIQPTVCEQLNEAIQDFNRYGRTPDSDNEDGALMIHITTPANVQLNEFISYAAPYSVLVSDSFTQIGAILSKSSTDNFQRQHGRQFSRGTIGAVLGITDYYLTFNPKSPPSRRIVLMIECFTMSGSEGSGKFGRPVPIENAPLVESFMKQLHVEWNERILGESSPLDQTSPVQSQLVITAGISNVMDGSTPETFSTQVPTKTFQMPSISGQADLNASRRALLDMLRLKQGKPLQIQDQEPPVTLAPRNTPNPPAELTNGAVDHVPILSVTMQNSGMPQSSAENPATDKLSGESGDLLLDNIPISQGAAVWESRISNDWEGMRVERNDAITDPVSHKFSIETAANARYDADKPLRYEDITPPVRHQPGISSQEINDKGNPWEGLRRIPRKYVQIPRDQRAILEGDRAWCSQAPGSGQPEKNLPPQVLDELQAFHDRLSHDVRGGHSDSQSDSCSEDSENWMVQKPSQRSQLGLGQAFVSLSSLGNENLATDLASPGSALSSNNKQSTNGIGTATKVDSEGEERIRKIEKPNTPVRNVPPNCKIISNFELDASRALQDIEDESPTEESISWASSPDRIEVHKSQSHLPQEGPQESTDINQVDSPNSPQAYTLSKEISPVAVRGAATPIMKEGKRNLELNPHFDLGNLAGPQPTINNKSITQPLEPSRNGHSLLFSSSPVEMEISVPYALESHALASDDITMTDALPALNHTRFSGERTNLSLNPERSESELHSRRPSLIRSHDVGLDSMNRPKQQIGNISSDPIIPGTYGSEVSNTFPRQAAHISSTEHARLDFFTSNANQVVSATLGSLTGLSVNHSLHTDDEKHLNEIEKPAESEEPTQGVRELEWNQDGFETRRSSNVQNTLQLSIPGTQASYFGSLRHSTHVITGDEIIFSTLATPNKRRAYKKRDAAEPSPKRRRTLQAVIFDSVQDKDLPIDPTEMAKANRRKFLNDLSLDDNPLIQSPQKSQEDFTARPHTATEIETSLEQGVLMETIRSPSKDLQDTLHFIQQVDPERERHEDFVPEELLEKQGDHTKHDIDCTDGGISDETFNENMNIQEDKIGPLRDKTASDHERDSIDKVKIRSCEDNVTILEMLSGSQHSSETASIFEIFNTAYPSYGKSVRAFIRACVYLDWLHSIKKAPHPSLWDDFIRAFSAEYTKHIDECRLSHQKAMSAHAFYNNHVPMPQFMKRIMTPTKLQEAFLLDPKETAKNCAIILKKKVQKGSESISTESSQLTVTSETSTESQESATLRPINSVSIPQLPSELPITNPIYPDHGEGTALALTHMQDLTAAQTNVVPAKKRFFETPGQLVTEASPDVVEPLDLNTSTPTAAIQVDVNINHLFEGPRAPDIEIIQATGLTRAPRHFPWSSSPQQRPMTDELSNDTEGVPRQSSTMNQKQINPHLSTVSALKEREGSPILGIETTSVTPAGSVAAQAGTSLASLTNLEFRQDLILRTADISASKLHREKTTSLSGLRDSDLKTSQRSRGEDGFYSLRMKPPGSPVNPRIPATFKDFSRTFVPRQKRRSNVFPRRPSTASTDSSPIKTNRNDGSNTFKSRSLIEPDTQAWAF